MEQIEEEKPEKVRSYLLDERLGESGSFEQVIGDVFEMRGEKGLVECLMRLEKSGYSQAPPYMLVKARIKAIIKAQQGGCVNDALKDDVFWKAHDVYAEVLVVNDENGILGNKHAQYIVDTVFSGLFLSNSKKIVSAIERHNLVLRPDAFFPESGDYCLMPIKEQNTLLDAIAKRDIGVLKDKCWVGNPDNVHIFHSFEEFNEASEKEDFTNDNPSYMVLRKFRDHGSNDYFGYSTLLLLESPGFLIRMGGSPLAKAMLVDEDWREHFKWGSYGLHDDPYVSDCSYGTSVEFGSLWNGIKLRQGVTKSGSVVGVRLEHSPRIIEE